jgi:hypothetical protein
MKMFFLLLGFVTKYRNNSNKNKLYDTNELQNYPMNMFDEDDVFLKFKPYYFNESGYDTRFNLKEDNDIALACIKRLYYLNNLLQYLQSNVNEHKKLEFIEEYNRYSDTSFIAPDISAAGLFDNWNNDFVL